MLEYTKSDMVYRNAFMKGCGCNDEMLKFLCNKLVAQNYDIYIRDVSYFGFPSFRIYIKDMSEMHVSQPILEGFSLGKYLLNLKKCSIQQLKQLAVGLEKINTEYEEQNYSPEYKLRSVFGMLNIIFKPDTDLHELLQDLDYFLAILYSRLADYEKAYMHLKKYIKRIGNELPGLKYYLCVLHFCKLRVKKEWNMQKIHEILNSIYGKAADEVIEDVSVPENAFRYYDLPSCGDCSRCSYSDERCSYPLWKDYMQKLQEKISAYPVGQEKLISLFREISDL
jgi:ribosomal protein S12 methylthiotransferase accessory factor